jgi:uncharacterized membrane protein HdeD (DUF308 family)
MRESIRARMISIAPWRDDLSWQASAVQGAIALAIGLYFLFATTHAVGTLAQIVGGFVAAISLIHLAQAVWDPAGLAARPSGILRRIVGVAVGSALLFSPWIDAISSQDARLIATGVLILSGVITIIGAFTDSRLREIRWGSSLSGLLEIVVGIVFFIVTDYDRPLMNVLGVLMIVAGLTLIGRAILTSGVLKSDVNDG